MKKLVVSSDWFGPFKEIVVEDDAYIGDGCIFPFSIYPNGKIEDYDSTVDVHPLPRPSIDAATSAFNTERSSRLSATDWWAIRASEPGGIPMTQEQLDYRQALRTMDDAEGFDVFNPDWPIKPN